MPVRESRIMRPFLYLYEKRPDQRTKQSVFAEWRYAFDRDSMAVNLRYMTDDWGVTSETLEARYRWNIKRAQLPRAAPALLHADRGRLLPHRAVCGRSAAASSPRPTTASADLDAYTVGAKYGHLTDRGEFSVRLEYYRQEGDAVARLGRRPARQL